ncbi:uncharacterized protein LOC131668654 [Phymastichus coffea]|uniref:uncharacterized protein LOC131668654 n=1 Tax=Phymastichus coffea TaxID=108790 RepID=UPI00273C2ED4|nr:uncharacterized protein LOC131668654 [Phymastichus coffea]
MSLKSSNRSLVASDSKRAAKTISCGMRNGKVSISASTNSPAPTAKPSSPPDEEKKVLTMKQEPEDEESYYEDEDEDEEEEESDASVAKPHLHHNTSSSNATSTSTGSSSAPVSHSRSFPMLTRVRSHSRSLRAMANPSAVWAHFDLCSNDPLRAQCRICGAVVVRGGANPRQCGTTNLHRHLRVHHGGRLIGRRYHVLGEFGKRDPDQGNLNKAMRLATQNLVRHMRSIAPAPTSQQSAHRQHEQQQHQHQHQHHQQQQQQPQQPQAQQQQHEQQQQQQRRQSPPSSTSSSSSQSQRPTKTLVLKTIPLKVKQIAPTTIKVPAAMRPSPAQQHALPQVVLPQPPTEVCLRWNSYHSNMQHSFPSLLDSEQFVDVTLACEGRSLKCHKMILSSCSDYLAQLLRENPCQHPIIIMRDLKFWEIEALVKFMYRGEVNVTHDKLPQLLNAAEALQVKGLAGPSNSQNPKPPLLIPQTKPPVPTSQPLNRTPVTETKDKPAKSISPPLVTSTPPNLSSPKRGQKRRTLSEVPEARPFTKIRLQQPPTAAGQRQRSLSPMVKVEPFEVVHSPSDPVYTDDNVDDEDITPSQSSLDKLLQLDDDDPGGDDFELADEGSDMDDDSTNNYAEEQMEFVPTDFLEQGDIADDLDSRANSSSIQFSDDDSKQDNENADETAKEQNSGKRESRPSRTKKDKT